MLHGIRHGMPRDVEADAPAQSGRFRQIGYEFAKFAAIGITGVFITNAVYDLLFIHLGMGPVLIQDATVGFNYYLLHLGHNKLAGLIALNSGIALATLFRFWSYRRFVWVTSPGNRAGDAGGPPCPAGGGPPGTVSSFPVTSRKRHALRPLR